MPVRGHSRRMGQPIADRGRIIPLLSQAWIPSISCTWDPVALGSQPSIVKEVNILRHICWEKGAEWGGPHSGGKIRNHFPRCRRGGSFV